MKQQQCGLPEVEYDPWMNQFVVLKILVVSVMQFGMEPEEALLDLSL